MDKPYLISETPDPELKFVDPDIAEACSKIGAYTVGLPTQIQLCRNLRQLLEFLKEEVKHGQ